MLISNTNPFNLKGLKQATYVLNSFARGKTAEEISEEFQGDMQLVKIWTNFLIHYQWIEITKAGRYSTTEKGKNWLDRIEQRNAS